MCMKTSDNNLLNWCSLYELILGLEKQNTLLKMHKSAVFNQRSYFLNMIISYKILITYQSL